MPTMTTHLMSLPHGSGHRLAAGILAAVALWPSQIPGAAIPEPDTILYGRIVNRSGTMERLVTAGTLTWNLRMPSGQIRSYTALLGPLQDGQFSYQLRLPHSALSLGLQSEAGSLPLPIDQVTYVFGDISVNGAKAVVHPEHAHAVVVNQSTRSQALRVDLDLNAPMPDSDGDEMPDWWEQTHDLDPFSAADASQDSDGDGLSNVAEWRRGQSPRQDNRTPTLAVLETRVYPTGLSGLALRVVDTNTDPSAITLVIASTPSTGELVVRNQSGLRTLRFGDRLMAADAHEGRLIYRRTETANPAGNSVSFRLALVDDPAAQATMNQSGWVLTDAFLADAAGGTIVQQEVRLRFVVERLEVPVSGWQSVADSASPMPGLTESAALRAKASLLASRGHSVVWDVVDQYADQTIQPWFAGRTSSDPIVAAQRTTEQPQILLGGSGDDRLVGAGGGDVLFGGTGDDELTGDWGADRFVIGAAGGHVRLTDFRPHEGDRVDLTRPMAGRTGHADDYIEYLPDGAGGTTMKFYADPRKSGDPLATVTFSAFDVSADSLPTLAAQGAFILGDLLPRPLVSVTGLEAGAENGLRPVRFLIHRVGDLSAPLTVSLNYSGSATAGVDYQAPASTLTIPSGQSQVELLVRPYSDGQSETDEVVRVALAALAGYRVSLAEGAAELVIRDLLPDFTVAVVRPEAVFQPWSAAQIRIRRDGLVDRQVVLELQWTGTSALNWIDPLPQFIDFGRGETTRLVDVRPRTSQAGPDQPLALTLRLVPDTSYMLGESAAVRLNVVPAALGFGDWVAQAHPGITDVAGFASSDPSGRGRSMLERFAFSLPPQQPDAVAASLPKIVQRQGRMGVEFVLRPGARELGVGVEISSDMRQWDGSAAAIREVVPALAATMPAGWRRFESTSANGSIPQFFQVRLNYAP